MLNTRPWREVEHYWRREASERMTFRDDGYAAVDWAARYLERVGEPPVLAQVEPGEIRARLPESAPEVGEPFSAA